ncbi:type II toxin-antitoxin system RelE/ParE family toxin [Pantoea agglomerans]|uniref:type II toxin-antitoxin system RelE/ParE family toxin n=1 Tax=Enterobacter agglomerans TaxID=549 RepID=UPI003DA08817
MGIYLTPDFDVDRRKARITNGMLCKTAGDIFRGLPGDPLGKFTYKKRMGLPGVSARNGARTIVFFNDGENIFFFDMYLKSALSKKKGKELEDDEIDAYCKIASDFISMSQELIDVLLIKNDLIEVVCDD